MDPIFEDTEKELRDKGYSFERHDFSRPWGGFFVINESHTEQFIKEYFPDYEVGELTKNKKISPKILLVAPEKRLSWQYHHRRSEVWTVVEGTVGVVKSDTDEEKEMKTYKVGDIITLKKGERHRLIGLKGWGKVAEIWQHTDPERPSDEDDIVRLQDDFKRK
jgi:mannose-6-phosphate isomerase-like protein (cupin superfamily)